MQNIEGSFGCVALSADLLKPNVANILFFNVCEEKFVQHGSITIVIDCNGFSLLIFEEKWSNYASEPKSAPNSMHNVLDALAFQCMRAGFLCPKYDNFFCLHTRQYQNELHLKRWSASSVSRSQAHFPALFKLRKGKTNYLSNQTWVKCYHSRNKH